MTGGAAAKAIAAATAIAIATVTAAAAATPRTTASANRQAAVRDARSLLSRLELPLGATRLSGQPRADSGTLAGPPSEPATPDVVDVHTWWQVSGRPNAVLAFIAAHPPAGGRLTTSGTFQGPGYAGADEGFSWPALGGVLETRSLLVTVTQLPDGSTGLRADAQDVWLIPRSAGELVPAGVHVVDVTRAATGQPPTLSLTVTDAAKVHKIVTLIDRLPIAQPGAWSCPALSDQGQFVTFTFRASAGGPALAQASQAAWATEPTTPCDPMSFAVRGRGQTPLLGGAAVVHEVGRLLAVKLATAFPTP